MTLNANIILQGQNPDLISAFGRGQLVGAQGNEIQRQNALNALYQEQGPGILAGDQNALNALSRMDPQAAMGVKQTGIENKRADAQLSINQGNFEMRRKEFAMQVEQQTLRMSAMEKQQAAQEIEMGIKGGILFHQRGDLPGLNAHLESLGVPPVQSLDEFPAVAVLYGDALEMLTDVQDAVNGPQPQTPAAVETLKFRAEQAGLVPGTPEYAQFMMDGGSKQDGMRVTSTPDGGLSIEQGSAVTDGKPAKFTESQSKDNVYVTRATGALQLLDSVGSEALTSRKDQVLDAVPLGIGRELQGESFQVAQQAGQEFLQAILRKDTGAAITEGEQVLYGKTYLPAPGDGPRVLEAKRQSRIRAIEAMKSGMNIQQVTVTERAVIDAARTAEETKPKGAADPAKASKPPADVPPDLWEFMTPEERALFE